MEQLKKCPFCNREAELRYDKDGFSFVVCANDGCYARTDGHLNEDAAITAWNRRKPLERIVERLESEFEKHRQVTRECLTTDDDSLGLRHLGKANAFSKAIEIVKEELN